MRQFLEKTAKEAGKLLMRYYIGESNHVRYKADREIVSAADLAADRLITRRIRQAYPRTPILSEEQPPPRRSPDDPLWIVDPLDGTTNFMGGNPIWGVNIALVRARDVVAGASCLPASNDLFLAERGTGAWRNKKRIRVSSQKKLSEATVIFCHGYTSTDMRRGSRLYAAIHPKIRYCRMFGSAAFEMSMVATGAADAFVYTGPKSWDIAPGVLLVEEAGGVVTDEYGRAWAPGRPVRVLISSNGRIHENLLRIIRRAL